jgi:hypothetical protein
MVVNMEIYIIGAVIMFLASVMGCLIGAMLVKNKITWAEVWSKLKSLNWEKLSDKTLWTSIIGTVTTFGAGIGLDLDYLLPLAALPLLIYTIVKQLADTAKAKALNADTISQTVYEAVNDMTENIDVDEAETDN